MTPEEAARALAADAVRDLEAAGFIKPCASIYDLTLRQARALAGVLTTLSTLWPAHHLEYNTLGDVLKVVPADKAEWVEFLLRWGGFVEDDDGPEVPDD